MLEKLTLDAVLGFLKKFWPHIVILGLVIALALTRGTLADARKELTNEADFRGLMKVQLGAKTDSGADLLHKAMAVMDESENRRVTLETISENARTAKQRANKADAALRREQDANARKFAAAQRTIKDLQGRRPTGDLARDMEIISRDSEAAWKGWW